MDLRIVGEQHEHILAEAKVQCHKEQGEDGGDDPRPIDHLLGSLLLPRSDVLADHGHGGVLDPLGDLIDDVVDAHAHAKGRRRHHACAVDHGIDEEHGQIDKSRLDCHGGSQSGDHFGVSAVDDQTFLSEFKAECLPMAEQVDQREDEGHCLSDDGCPGGACHAPAQHTRKEDVQHQIHCRGDPHEQKGAFGVSHATEDGGDHIIPCGEEQSAGADDQIIHCHGVGFRGDVHPPEDGYAEQKDQSGHRQGQNGHEHKEGTDHLVHFLFLFCAQRLCDQDLSSAGKAKADHGHEVDDQAALGHS